jgi:hypothetical protein
MDELRFLREQLRVEAQQMRAVCTACVQGLAAAKAPAAPNNASARDDFARACAEYLSFAAQSLAARHAAQIERLHALEGAAEPGGSSPRAGTAMSGAEALERIVVELGGTSDIGEINLTKLVSYAEFIIEFIDSEQATLAPALERAFALADWRRTAQLDADTILNARERGLRILQHEFRSHLD